VEEGREGRTREGNREGDGKGSEGGGGRGREER